MSFYEVRFPDDLSYGSVGGAEFRTTVIETDSGAEQRVARWTGAGRRRYDAAYAIRSHDTLSELIKFQVAMQGQAHGFRFKDWSDYTSADNHRDAPAYDDKQIGTGDGSATQFQLSKLYIYNSVARLRKITKPVSGTVKIGVNGSEATSGWTVNTTTGVVTFDTAPTSGHVVTAGYEFDVPVRFGDDILSINYETFASGGVPGGIPLVELIDDDPVAGDFWFGGAKQLTYASDVTIGLGDGRAIRLVPGSANLKVFLPEESSLALGGPYFVLLNAGSGDALIRTSADGAVYTLTTAIGAVEVYLGLVSGTPTWMVLS